MEVSVAQACDVVRSVLSVGLDKAISKLSVKPAGASNGQGSGSKGNGKMPTQAAAAAGGGVAAKVHTAAGAVATNTNAVPQAAVPAMANARSNAQL